MHACGAVRSLSVYLAVVKRGFGGSACLGNSLIMVRGVCRGHLLGLFGMRC